MSQERIIKAKSTGHEWGVCISHFLSPLFVGHFHSLAVSQFHLYLNDCPVCFLHDPFCLHFTDVQSRDRLQMLSAISVWVKLLQFCTSPSNSLFDKRYILSCVPDVSAEGATGLDRQGISGVLSTYPLSRAATGVIVGVDVWVDIEEVNGVGVVVGVGVGVDTIGGIEELAGALLCFFVECSTSSAEYVAVVLQLGCTFLFWALLQVVTPTYLCTSISLLHTLFRGCLCSGSGLRACFLFIPFPFSISNSSFDPPSDSPSDLPSNPASGLPSNSSSNSSSFFGTLAAWLWAYWVYVWAWVCTIECKRGYELWTHERGYKCNSAGHRYGAC